MRSGSVGDSEPLTVEPWQRLQAVAEWDELLMPAATVAALRALPDRLSERFWSDRRGRAGLLAVFRGPAGVGKTLAVRAVAAELHLPVFQANLARLATGGAIQSGRGLAQLFSGAQQSGAVVELDGAEALGLAAPTTRFGPIDTSDLLRRCETYPGLVVVSCRYNDGPIERIAEVADLVLDFGLPDAVARVELWRRHLPAEAQVGEGELALLADGFPVSAGAIVTACESAAEQAEAEGVPLVLAHLTAAVKLAERGRAMPATEGAAGRPAAYRPPERVRPRIPEPPRPRIPEPPRPRIPEPPPARIPDAPIPMARTSEPPPTRVPEPTPSRSAEPTPARSAEPTPARSAEPTPARSAEPTPARSAEAARAATIMRPARSARPGWRQAVPARLLAIALIGGLAAIGLGLVAAGGHNNAPAPQVALDRQVTTGPLRFSYPSAWGLEPARALPGLKLSTAVTVGTTRRPQGQLVIGTMASTQSGLPAAFVSTLSGQPEPDLVTLGSQKFYRLLDSGLSAGGAGEAAYVLSTGGRTVVAVCHAGVQAFAALCERVLATLHVTPAPSASPSSLTATYVTGLNTVLTSLGADRKRELGALAAAHTAAAQSKAASALSQLLAKAAHAVAALPAGNAAKYNTPLGNALSHMSSAYGDLGRAAARNQPHAYAKAQADIARANGEIAAALAALKKLGYQAA